MLQIINGFESPDSTYFGTQEAQPELEYDETSGQQVLKLVNGTGYRRSWGSPGVTSTIILNNEDMVSIHVGFFHKHGGGQFWRHYCWTDAGWAQFPWRALDEERRIRILDAFDDRAPSWADVPGKLRQDYRRPVLETLTTYKLVEYRDERYFSVFDPSLEYTLGKRLAEKALGDHRAGYYSYPDIEGLRIRFDDGILFPEECYQRSSMVLALIECEISGTILDYGSKLASTYLRPVQVLEYIVYENSSLSEAS